MQHGWIVVSHDRHSDDAYWVCVEREDALTIAAAVTEDWRKRYSTDLVDRTLYGNLIFRASVEDGFRVTVEPQRIRGSGECEL